ERLAGADLEQPRSRRDAAADRLHCPGPLHVFQIAARRRKRGEMLDRVDVVADGPVAQPRSERSRTWTERALVEPHQLLCARGPAEAPLRECPCTPSEAKPQLLVVEEPLEHARDLECIAPAKENGFLAILDEPADVGRRQHDWSPGRKELWQL